MPIGVSLRACVRMRVSRARNARKGRAAVYTGMEGLTSPTDLVKWS